MGQAATTGGSKDRLSLLIAYVHGAHSRPFCPGRHDCALFAAGWVKLITGLDLARGHRSKYRSVKGGHARLRQAGYAGPVALAAAHLTEVPPAFAQPGDLAVLDEATFGLLAGEMIYGLGPQGLAPVPRGQMRRAFAVGRP